MSAPPQHLLTAEEFAALPLSVMRYELVRGEIVTMPPACGSHGKVTMRLGGLLAYHTLTHQLGEAYAAETGFLIAHNPDTVRAPDVAFIQASRLTPDTDANTWIPVMPDLVAEVVSSGDRPTEIAEKVCMWLDAEVRLVWVACPGARTIEVHRLGQPVRTLRDGETLAGEDVVPGFALAVTDVFG
jgi:Uma2 family endonuclease